MSWSYSPIGAHVQKIQSWNPVKTGGEEVFSYIDLSSVDKEKKCIILSDVPKIVPAEAPSRARQLVRESDVLVATVRPNLNGVAEVPGSLDGATASTGYCVLRANEETLHSKFLFYWVQTKAFVLDMIAKATGANYPAVSDRIIKESEIPLPPMDEQKRIAAILDKADNLRRKRQQAIQLADEFLRAVFLDMFGDPVTNPKGWPVKKLCDVGELDRGKSKHRPRNDPALLGGKHPLIQTGDVANSKGYITEFTSTYSDVGLLQSKKWPADTLCITIAANIAKTGILTFESCFPDSVVGFTPNEYSTVEYVQHWLGFLQQTLEASAPESAQKNINLAILRGLDLPVPPLENQERFSEIVGFILANSHKLDVSAGLLSDLFSALSQKAFAGEL